jgi:signal peptidase
MTDDGEGADRTPLRTRVPWRRIASTAGVLLLVVVVVPFVVYAVPQVVGGNGSYAVLSGSMEPNISAGDVIITEGVGAGAIERGDVITFRRSGDTRPTTHRVIEVVDSEGEGSQGAGGLAFRTQGDANENPDQQLVSPDSVNGRVMTVGGYLFVIPYLGYVIQFAGTQTGFVALFVVPLVLLVLSEIWEAANSVRTDGESGDDHAPEANDGSEGAPHAADSGDESADEGGQITFTAPELQLALIVLGLFLVYSVWVTYVTLEIWAFAVAGSVATAFLLLGSIYAVGGDSADDDATEEDEETVADEPPALDTDQVGVIFPDIESSGDDGSAGSPSPGMEGTASSAESELEHGVSAVTPEEASEGESDD